LSADRAKLWGRGLSVGTEFREQRRELRGTAAARQNHAATALLGETAHTPNCGMAIHVGHDDHDIATLDERAQGRCAATGEVPIVVLEVVPGALREVFVKPLVAIEAADDTDVHGCGSK